MQTWIALFRGINVGGNNRLPMAELRRELETRKLRNVRTYIQSGNVVFESAVRTAASLSERIRGCVEECHGFRPEVLVLQRDDLVRAIENNPFPDAVQDPRTLHLNFLAGPPSAPDLDALDRLRAASERYELAGRVLYFHAPDGLARSRLAANAEKHLGVVMTGRNFRTVEKLQAMAGTD